MPDQFDYRTATKDQIAEKAAEVVGRPLDSLSCDPLLRRPSSAQTKGVVGSIYESFFGMEPNSIAGPDFGSAEIELKSVPILLSGVEARAKERISLGMINWQSLPTETWETARARRKLEHLMLIFYAWSPLVPMGRFQALVAGLWKPDPETMLVLENDWHTIQRLEIEGRRGEVSESLTQALGAATKGVGHGSTSRAWSLKQPFVSWIYGSMVGRRVVRPPVRPIIRDPQAAFEATTIAQLATLKGLTVGEVASRSGLSVDRSKSAAASVIRRVLGLKSQGRVGDFERFGVETKLVPLDGRGHPVEATSFPSFVHEELAFETWEDSDLLGRLNRILFVPVTREKGQAQAEAVIGKAFFWSPAEAELEGIRREWENVRALISAGLACELPKASQTKFIHVRPKARDARDSDPAPGGFDVTKKCFWLNAAYVEQIIREHSSPLR